MKRYITSIGIISLTIILFGIDDIKAQAPFTDYLTHNEPVMSLPVTVGGKTTDPDTGATYMRITDSSDCAGKNITAYSFWPSFSTDNSYILIHSDCGTFLRAFNSTTFTLGAKITPPTSIGPYGPDWFNGATWSTSDNDKIFVQASGTNRIYTYSVATNSYTFLADINVGGAIPVGDYFQQYLFNEDNQDLICSGKYHPASNAYTGTYCYKFSTASIKLNTTDTEVNEVHPSPDGNWVLVDHGGSIIDLTLTLYNLVANTNQSINIGSPHFGESHNVMFPTLMAGGDDDNGKYLTGRNFTSFTTQFDLLGPPNVATDYSQGTHTSPLARTGTWALIESFEAFQPPSTSCAGTGAGCAHTNGPFRNELFLVKMDGSQAVYRFAHHWSRYNSYYDSPRANISRDGRYVAFSSNRGTSIDNGGRLDMYVVNIPDSPAAVTSRNFRGTIRGGVKSQ